MMEALRIAFDLAVVLCLISLGVSAMVSVSLRRCVVLFMAFGLVMAFAWTRLGAPDIALVEAAIGSGLTGAMLIAAIGILERDEGLSKSSHEADE